MLTREQFKTLIIYIMAEKEKGDRLDEALREYAPSDFTGFCKETDDLLEFLEDVMGDTDGTISWWMYETEYGEREEMINIWEKDDPDDKPTWRIKTLDDLYNYIYAHHKEAPSKKELKSLLFQQEQGFKFALSKIRELRDTNTKTANKGYEERNYLLNYLLETLPNDYIFATGVGHLPDIDEGVFIISTLDGESDEEV